MLYYFLFLNIWITKWIIFGLLLGLNSWCFKIWNWDWLLRRLTFIHIFFSRFINSFFYFVFNGNLLCWFWESKLILKSLLRLLRSIPWLLFPGWLLIPIRWLYFRLFPSRLIPCLFDIRLLLYLSIICFFPSLLLNIWFLKRLNLFNCYFIYRRWYIRGFVEICYLTKKKRVCIIRFLFLKFYLMLLKVINLRRHFNLLDWYLFLLLWIWLLFYKWK